MAIDLDMHYVEQLYFPVEYIMKKNKMNTNIKIDFIYRWPNVRQIRPAW